MFGSNWCHSETANHSSAASLRKLKFAGPRVPGHQNAIIHVLVKRAFLTSRVSMWANRVDTA